MSQESVEVVRMAAEACNAGDRERLFCLMDPEIVFQSAVEQKAYRGLDGMMRYRENLDATLEDFHTENDRFLDAGTDRVVHLYRIVGRGAGSGVPVSHDAAGLYQLRNGKILKGQVYLDQRQALEAAGLRE